MVGSLWQEIRITMRSLLRSPRYTIISLGVLVIGIGATTAVFGLVDALMLRELPVVEDPEEVVGIYRTRRGEGFDTFSFPNYLDYRGQSRAFSDILAYQSTPVSFATGDESERLVAAIVTANYFDVLRVDPPVGRGFLPQEGETPGAAPVAVISHGLWQRAFGSRSDVLEQVVQVNGRSYRIVGVAPEGFLGTDFLSRPEIFLPMMMEAQVRPRTWNVLETRDNNWLRLVGRLAPGITLEEANVELATIAARLEKEYPLHNQEQSAVAVRDVGVVPNSKGEVRALSGLLAIAAAIVLLTACANFAGLLLARGTARFRELATRLALGARRIELVRYLLLESLLLSLGGAVGGIFLALWLGGATRSLAPVPLGPDAQLDLSLLGFAILLAVFTGLLSGVMPSFLVLRTDLRSVLHEVPAPQGKGRYRLRDLLVVAQVALSFILLFSGGLVVRGLLRAQEVDTGFRHQGVQVGSIDLELHGYDDQEALQLYQSLLEGLDGRPDVRHAAVSSAVPILGPRSTTTIYIEGDVDEMSFERCECSPSPSGDRLPVDYELVSPGYFETLEIPILQGRAFDERDRLGGTATVIVNETLARLLWPDESAIGRRIRTARTGPFDFGYQVVGVARDSKYFSITEGLRPHLYMPLFQESSLEAVLFVRGGDDDSVALVPTMRRELRAIDPSLPIFNVRSLSEVIGRSLWLERFVGFLMTSFGLLALLLAGAGLYGLISYLVVRRTREIGLRLALGADRGRVMRMIVRQGLVSVAIGLVVGAAASYFLMPILDDYLTGLSVTDPVTATAIVLLLLAVTMLAGWAPARRATRIAPQEALRVD